MLKKRNRLKWKEVNFLFKKQKIVPWKLFSFLYYEQYPDCFFNKFSIQIPVKISKKSVKRNFIKRTIYDYLKINNLEEKKIGNCYYKIFILINKKTVPVFKNLLETKDSEEVKKEILDMFDISFKNLYKNLWKKSGNLFNPSCKKL